MSTSAQVWDRFDRIAQGVGENSPWRQHATGRPTFSPSLETLCQLLSIPLELGADVHSGLPAKAVDVWVASELRRAGFGIDEVWPRPATPRVLPRELSLLLKSLPRNLRETVSARLRAGSAGGAVSADASVLGKAYFKQVDVVVSQWARGPELLISTKRMDSSLSNNAFNRIEESYGDAHNLRGRHPLAAIGYIFVVRASALDESPAAAERLVDLVAKLGHDPAGYDATCVLVVEWDSSKVGTPEVTAEVVEDRVADELGPGPFFESMIDAVLDRTPVSAHVRVRELRANKDLSVTEDQGR